MCKYKNSIFFQIIKYYGAVVTLLQPNENIDWTPARFKNIDLKFEVMLKKNLMQSSLLIKKMEC